MLRSLEPEIMDQADIDPALLRRFHRDLANIHRALGTFATIERFIRQGPTPVRRVLDLGCGGGDLLAYLRRRMGVEVIGVDLKPGAPGGIPTLVADATADPLPEADVAVSSLVAHHLTPEQNADLIRNVRRSCPRLLIHDLVRHPLPLALFSIFLGPLISREAAADGRQSVRRAFTPAELSEIVRGALGGAGKYDIDVSPLLSRQIADIRF